MSLGEVSGDVRGNRLGSGKLPGVQLPVALLRCVICSGTETKVCSGNRLLVTASVLTHPS